MKKLLSLLLFVSFTSCKPMIKLVFNVRDAKKIETRIEADNMNKRIINKFDIDYVMLYRTDYYLEQTNDTSFWSGELKYFSYNHVLFDQHTNYCSSVSFKDINADSLISYVNFESEDSLKKIDKYLIGLEYLEGAVFYVDSIELRKYNIVMDFNTWWKGPEKRRIRRISKALPKDSTLYILINKDYILEDDIELYDYVKKDTID